LYLKRVDLVGFKSFAKKLNIDLGRGITAIVGPNGSGKTNVVDAIRWALGEQSPRLLRSSRMSDVIFGGTRTRKPLGMAEVSLTIVDEGNLLPIDYSEVTVTRRVFRSGENEYYLNKNACRLKDIKDLFMDTGVGSKTYSVMEREMVDQILSETGNERRALLEEAAGIMRYKIKKQSAERKLGLTEQDLTRLQDIIGELEKRVRSLKRQVARARRYRRLNAELRSADTSLAATSLEKLRGDEGSMKQKTESLTERDSKLTSQISSQSAKVERIKFEASELEGKAKELREDLARRDRAIGQTSDTLIAAGERRKANEERQELLRNEVEELDSYSHELASRLKEQDQRISKLAEKESALAVQLDEAAGELGRTREALAQLKGELEAERTKAWSAVEGTLVAKEEYGALKARQETLRARGDQLSEVCQELESKIQAIGEEIDRVRSREELLHGNIAELESESRDILSRKNELEEQDFEVGQDLENLSTARKIAAEKIGILEGELSRTSMQLETLKKVCSMPVSTLRSKLEIVEGMEKAIEALFLPYMSCAPLEGTLWKDAAAAVRVQNLERTRIARGDLSIGGSTAEYEHLPGVIGPASNFVKGRDESAAFITALSGRALVVEDLESAGELLSKGFEGTVVTTDGDIVRAEGIVEVGTRVDVAGQDSIEHLESEIQRIDDEIRRLEKARQHLKEDIRSAGIELEQISERRTSHESTVWELRGQVAGLLARRDLLISRKQEAVEERTALDAKLSEVGEAIRRSEEGTRQAEKSSGLVELEKRVAEAESGIGEKSRRLRDLELEKAVVSSETKGSRTEKTRLTELLEKNRQEIRKKKETLGEIGERLEELASQIAGGREKLQAMQLDRDKFGSICQAKFDELDRLSASVGEAEAEIIEFMSERDEVRGNRRDIEVKLASIEAEKRAIIQHVRSEWGITPNDLKVDVDDVTEEMVDEIRDKLRQLGPVNLLALEEYEKESERLEFLTSQRDDVIESRDALRDLISKINVKATEVFLETFEEVKGNFKSVFLELFEDGQADLTLSDESDPLESPIEIVASPKGKRLQRISLLSAGERALTAIALLFGIYKVKPSPFCILDELDAPLDEPNTVRFVHMLRRCSAQSQFIVVTHNKRTMEAADFLCGVTMEEPGVSKLVSVKLDESEMVPENETEAVETTQGTH
jgi:chromosome segregation protein